MPRYQARYTNGTWQTFDTLQYCAVEVHYTQKEAERAVAMGNDWAEHQASKAR